MRYLSSLACGRGRVEGSIALSQRKREKESKIMGKNKAATCNGCGSSEALYVQLRNGERLPSYVMRIGEGIYCNACAGEGK